MGLMALSHSRLSDFNQCPRKFKLKYIDKAKNMLIDDANKSVHLVRGQNVHKALENYVIKRKEGYPANLEYSKNLPEVNAAVPLIEKYIANFGIDNVHPERQICVDSSWNSDQWFSKQAYYRAIFDLISISSSAVVISDYKTGKFTDYTPDSGYGQLELSAAIALSIWDVEAVNTEYLYVDHKKSVVKTYSQKDKIQLVEHFDSELIKVNEEQNFDPKKNQFCKWCDATKDQCPNSPKV